MSLTAKVLIGLAAGLLAGLLVSASGSPTLLAVAGAIEPVGTIFINAIRMAIIPLVAATLVAGVAGSADTRAIGRIGWRAGLIFAVLLTATALVSLLLAPPLLRMLPLSAALPESVSTAAVAAAAEGAKKIPTLGQWLVDLVPPNPVKAAADGAMLPLILFSIVFGLALTRLAAPLRASIVTAAQAVAEAMLVVVRWVLALAPIGVFALALPLAARMGLAALGAVASYIALVSGLLLLSILALVAVGVVVGRHPPRRFLQASLPAQAVAISSRSSLAALPAMIEGARTRLGAGPGITGFFLPLSASVFRVGGVVQMVVGVLFLARLYGIAVEPAQYATIAVLAMVLSLSVPGVPNGSIIVMVPILTAVGVPLEGIALLLGVDTIPDMFRTTSNVTGHMTAAALLTRGGSGGGTEDASVAAPADMTAPGAARPEPAADAHAR